MEKVNLEKRKRVLKYINSFFFIASTFLIFKYSNFKSIFDRDKETKIKYDKDGYISSIDNMKFEKGVRIR